MERWRSSLKLIVTFVLTFFTFARSECRTEGDAHGERGRDYEKPPHLCTSPLSGGDALVHPIIGAALLTAGSAPNWSHRNLPVQQMPGCPGARQRTVIDFFAFLQTVEPFVFFFTVTW